MSAPAFLREHDGAVMLALKVQPRASRCELAGPLGGELKLKVTAPPVDSAANEAVLRLLADVLDCPRGSVQLIRGNTSRHKQILIQRIPLETVVAKLGAKG